MYRAVWTLLAISWLILVVGCSRGPSRLEGISSLHIESGWFFSELAWSPDGRYIAATVETRRDRGIYVIDIESQAYHSIKEYDDRIPYEAQGAAWSPDSHSLILLYPPHTLYLPATNGRPGQSVVLSPYSIVILDARTGEYRQGVWDGNYATWGANLDEVIVVDSDIGRLDEDVPIYLVNLATGHAREIAEAEASLVAVSEALDASVLGSLVFRKGSSFEIVSIRSGEQIGSVESAESENRLRSPRWSPDGRLLAYIEVRPSSASARDWRHVLYLSNADGSCQSEPLDIGFLLKSVDWSPDGQQLVFSINKPGAIYFLDLTTGVGKDLSESFHRLCG
jgi:Tol biopolymer transport system component